MIAAASSAALTLTAAWAALVLAGGPIGGASLPAAAPLAAGAMAGALTAAFLRAGGRRSHAARRMGATTRAAGALLPFVLLAAATYARADLAHVLVVGELGWLLAAVLPVVVGVGLGSRHARSHFIDIGLGALAGGGLYALIRVAIDDRRFDPTWAPLAWATGALAVWGFASLSPRPAWRAPAGAAVRALPLALPWVAALVVTAPAAPRHELASSAGAQALALLLAAYAVGAAVTLWRAETLRPELGYVGALQAQAARVAPWLAIASLLGAGVLQAASYIAITVDDLARYWSVADSLSHGLGYDVWAGGGGTAQAGAGEQWMDPPALPAFQAVTFAVLGHTLPAALAPMFVANSALPALAYLAARALGVGYGVAYAAGLLTAVTPPIQIYSLGAAEPDPIFAAGLALVGALFAQVLRSRRPRVLWLAFGAAAGLVALTRPEGPLYATLLLAAAAAAQRSRWTVAGLVTAGVLVAPFMGLSQALVGRPWPQQPQGLSFGNLATNLGIGFDQVWPRTGRLLLLDDARFSVLGGALALSFVGGAAALVRRRWALGALPLAALLNLGITLGIDPGALRTTETSELIRHVAPAFPAIVLVGAVGVDVLGRAAAQWAVRRRWRVVPGRLTVGLGVVAGTYLAAGSLYLLATPEEFHHGGGNGALLRADIYVNAPELWRDPYPLPCPPCAGPTWDFNDFRFQLFARFRPLDVHSGSDGAAYQTLTGALAALGFAASLGRGVTPAAPLSGRAVRSAAPGAPDAA